MKIQILSREIIKPCYPTPHHLRTHKLSYIDQLAPRVYIPIVLFYSASSTTNEEINRTKRCSILKDSLSRTLTHFYPFAGRVKDCYSIDCNDDGATYVEAQVDSHMSVVLKEPEADVLLKLLPFDPVGKLSESSAESDDQVLLAVQVNYFACGAMAIGVCISHVVADASAAASFLKTWAALATGIHIDLDGVIYDCTHLFPPQDFSGLSNFLENFQKIMLGEFVLKRFVFDGSKIAALRNEIGDGTSPYCPTRVEAVSSLIWNAIMGSEAEDRIVPNPMHMAIIAVNLRKKMNPPLPQLCMSNICHAAMVNSDKAKTTSLNNLAEKIHESIWTVNDSYIRQLFGSGEVMNILTNMAAYIENSSKNMIVFSSWCRFPFYETDFGWGKPVWFASPLKSSKSAIFLDSRDGNGIEAWITLPKDEMTKLEQDPGIIAYASLNQSNCCI